MSSSSRIARIRPILEVGIVHVALFLSLWLASVLVFALVFAPAVEWLWFAVDAIVVGIGAWVVYRKRHLVGFAALGSRKWTKLAVSIVIGMGAVLVCWWVVDDWNMIALDESNYLLTLREERIIPDGLLPFNIRWLVPFFAGPWNVLPVADAAAIKALNFGAFVITAVGLILLLVRIRVPFWLALAAPAFLLSSYLGIYGASNRLVLDPANYALYILLFHALLRREHWPYFSAILFIDALNAEKAVYWIPVFVLVTLLREGPPWTKRSLLDVAALSLKCLAPTLLYLLALWIYLAPSRLEANLCFENLHLMSFSDLGGAITDNVKMNNFQTLWLPFGPFTVYALFGFALESPRYLKPIVLLIIPFFIQAVIACDTDRMLAYAFIVYLPFGYLYLARAYREMPRWLAVTLFSLSVAVAITEHYLFHLLKQEERYLWFGANFWKMVAAGVEIGLVSAIVFAHFTFFSRSSDARRE